MGIVQLGHSGNRRHRAHHRAGGDIVTALEWAMLTAMLMAVLAAVVLIGWPLCAMSAQMDQQDEDRYGADDARRS